MKEPFYLNKCVQCKEMFTGYRNEVTCPMCVDRNSEAINKIFQFSDEK